MKFIVCVLVLFSFVVFPSKAYYEIETDKLKNALDYEYREYIGDPDIETIDFSKSSESLMKSFFNNFKLKIKETFASSFGVVLCCILSSLINNFSYVSESKIGVKSVNYTCSIVIILLTITSGGIISNCADAISNVDNFSKILTPIFAISTAVAKYPLTAVTVASTSLIFTNIFTSIVINLIIPCIYMFAILYIIGTLTDTPMLYKLCDLFKWCITMFYKIFNMVFIGYISLSGMISSASDMATIKTAKTVINNSVPIVGSIIADASDAILSGANILRSSIGVFGFLGVCSICLVPFVGCLANYVVFKVISALSSSITNSTVAKAIDGVSSAYGLSLASLATCCTVQFISVVVTSAVTNL